MTKEEAIDVLKKTIAYESDFAEAKRMAIEALQEYEKVKAYMDTLVDAFIEDGKELAESVKVVRCKDCKHRSYEGWCDVYIQPRMDTDFCNHGERQCNYFEYKGSDTE